MPRIEHDIEIACPAELVWEVWTDVRRLPELSRSTVEVGGAPPRITAIGQTFTQVVKAAGRCWEATWVVTELAALHLAIEGKPGFGVRVHLAEDVEPLGRDRSRARLTIDYRLPFGPAGRLAGKLGLGRLAERETVEVLENLRTMVEQVAEQRVAPAEA
jgi:uncharacterized membrane protein